MPCRLASTPAMFNSTLTEDEAFLCPVDGAIMITGICWSHCSGSYKLSSAMIMAFGTMLLVTLFSFYELLSKFVFAFYMWVEFLDLVLFSTYITDTWFFEFVFGGNS